METNSERGKFLLELYRIAKDVEEMTIGLLKVEKVNVRNIEGMRHIMSADQMAELETKLHQTINIR